MDASYVTSLTGHIRIILEKADLDSVSAKSVRKTLVSQGYNADQIKANKPGIDGVIAEIFNEIRSRGTDAALKTPGDRKPQVKRSLSETEPDHSEHKAKKAVVTKVADDESYARALQAEYNGLEKGGRASRSGQTRTPTKSKAASNSKSKFKSAATLSDSDGEPGAKVEGAAKKRRKVKVSSGEIGEAPDTGFNRPMLLSPSLGSLLGETHLSRPKTVKALWVYIKAHDLQDPKDKRYICCDEPMRAVFQTDRVHMMGMNKTLSNHLYNPDDVVARTA